VSEVRRLRSGGDLVGESATWCVRSQRLFWVDITGREIHALDPRTGRHEAWPTPGFVTSVGLRRDGGAVVGLEHAVALWDYSDQFTPLAVVEPDLPGNRLNEGKVGPDGWFWVGTMQNNLTPDGAPQAMDRDSGGFYRVSPSGRVEPLTPREHGICNTMAWADHRFYCADTLTNALYVFAHGPDGLTDRRRLGAPFARGLPDGSALDAEGCLWNCRVGGGCVARFAPDGSVDRVLDLPCTAPTSCAFGGEDLRTLFVTSARFGLPDDRRDHPDEGALFAVEPGVAGLAEHFFG
jgi:sugar lactone lactonase YvrE